MGDRARLATRADLDLADLGSIEEALDLWNPSLVINCAAYTNVDAAETEEALATRINTEAVGRIADWTQRHERPFLTFSTDYVFDGKGTSPYLESDAPDPVNAYGRSKLGGEALAVDAGGLVVRTSWVISGSHPNFVATMLRLSSERQLRVVDDQVGCPTIASDLAAASLEALQGGATGLLHLTNQGPTTWFELARAAVSEAGKDPGVIQPCTTEEYPTPARRPAYSVLGSERRESLGVHPLPEWRESLPGLVRELKTWV